VDDREHVIYNFVNGLLLRPYISGRVWDMSGDNLALMAEGIALYKEIRGRVREALPFFPLGFNDTAKDAVLAYGLRHEGGAYLAVLAPHADEARIPLDASKGQIQDIRIIYPKSVDCSFEWDGHSLRVKLPRKGCGRLFEITYL
jgi:alpha-galactosidase